MSGDGNSSEAVYGGGRWRLLLGCFWPFDW
jgi:hypothetical protein